MKTIELYAPQTQKHYDHISDYHPPVPADQFDQEVREGYARRTPLILQYAAKGGRVGVNFMHFTYKPNADAAWMDICSEGIPLYPYYPFLHFFASFACPWRRLAVMVEEEESPWTPEQVQQQQQLLTLSGWGVFWIPSTVAKMREEDLLPDHIYEALTNGYWEEGEKEEYEALKPRIRTESMDGFFRWLKRKHFSPEALAQHQAAERERMVAHNKMPHPSKWPVLPPPTPEEIAERFKPRLPHGPVPLDDIPTPSSTSSISRPEEHGDWK